MSERCRGGVVLHGTYYRCHLKAGHDLACTNLDAPATWASGDAVDRFNEQLQAIDELARLTDEMGLYNREETP